VTYVALVASVAVAIVPVYWMITISLKTEADQFSATPSWIGFAPTLSHYWDAFGNRSFGRYLLTSAIVSFGSTICAVTLGTAAAYALARIELPRQSGRRISLWILSTRMLPPIATAVPLFMLMRSFGLIDTIAGLILIYTGLNLPFAIWMMRGFFRELPRELEEAAMVDGDSRMGALVRIILPLVRPGLAATAVFCLIVSWNEFLLALVLTQTDASMTLPVAIAGRVTQYEIEWGVMSAAGVVAMLPILIFALAVQRHLVRGLSLGAVKG
jgi:multiple sugar transport system permease protein